MNDVTELVEVAYGLDHRTVRPSLWRRLLRKAIQLTGADEARNNYQIRRAYYALGRLLMSEGKRDEGAAAYVRV